MGDFGYLLKINPLGDGFLQVTYLSHFLRYLLMQYRYSGSRKQESQHTSWDMDYALVQALLMCS